MVSEDYHEKRLKRHADSLVRKCIADNYHTGKMGYIIMVGGEALNFHLPESKQVETADFDLKFVVIPKFTDTEENLRRANVKRLYIAHDLFNCLKSIKPPKGYKKVYPRLTMLFNNIVHHVRLDGHKVYITNPETGEERFTVYRFNKIFTIKLVYQPNDRKTESEFTLIDLGLFYRLPEEEPYYNFLSNTIYDTFLKPPFRKGIPIPFAIKDKIRFPTMPYILVDNFRMLLLANDFLYIYADNPDRIDFFKLKLKGYQKKLEMILREFDHREKSQSARRKSRSKTTPTRVKERTSTEIATIEKQIKKTVKLYASLAKRNVLCYREEGKFNFSTVLQQHHPECDHEYLDDLDLFFDNYQETLELIYRKLMPKRRSPSRNNSRNRSSRNRSSRNRNRNRSRKRSRNRRR